MPAPARCPNCNNPVPPEAEDCPSCPMTFREPVSAQQRRQGLGPSSWPPVVWVFILAAAGFGAWKGISYLIDYADRPDEEVGLSAMRNDLQKKLAGRASEQEQAAVDGEPRSPGTGPGPRSAPGGGRITTERPGEKTVEVSAAQGSEPTPDLVKEWRLRGTVYDLVALKPVPGCPMVFADSQTGSRQETSSDGQGRYRIIVAPLSSGGYAVRIQCPGYAQSYLNPGTENVPGMPQQDRRELSRDLAKSLDAPYTVQAYGKEPLVTDFYVAPLNP